jgi:hypothetical protein
MMWSEAAACLVLFWLLSLYLSDVVGCLTYLVATLAWHPDN